VIYRFGVMATLLVALTVFRAARAVLSDGRLANLIETALYVAAIGAFLAYAAQLAALRWHGRVAVWAGLSGVVGVALLMGAVPAPDRFLVGVLVAQAALAAAVWRLWGRGHALVGSRPRLAGVGGPGWIGADCHRRQLVACA